MLRETTAYVDRCMKEPLKFEPDVSSREDSVAFCDGGYIPVGFEFVISRISYRGVAAGDSNGHGEFVVRAGNQAIAQVRDSGKLTESVWVGEIVIRSGEESTVFVEVANSSAGEAVFEGVIRPTTE